MNIIDFTVEWIPSAERLAMGNYEEERSIVPALPELVTLPPLDSLAKNGLGVAAVEDGKLLGFLGACGPWKPAFGIQSLCGVYSPIHAHGAVKENRIGIYRRMYQAAAEKWVKAGAASHAVSLYAHDAAANEAFFVYGFGVRCLDLMRDVSGPECSSLQDIACYELPASRQHELREMRRGLSAHLAQSPCFMKDSPDDLAYWIGMKEQKPPRTFVAEKDGRIAAYFEAKEEGENFASSAQGTLNICGAYCLPEYRGGGIAQSLLSYMISVLRSEGFERIGVDCESFNPTALGFWSKHFRKYTHSVVRRIDENVFAFQ